MFTVLLLAGIFTGFLLLANGLQSSRFARFIAGIIVLTSTVLFFGAMSLWGEMLWFQAAGFSTRFWTVLLTRVGGAILAAATAGGIAGLLTVAPLSKASRFRYWPTVLAAGIGALWGWSSWSQVLLYANRVRSGVADPIFGHDTGFYLFALPLYDRLWTLLLLAVLIAGAAAVRTLVMRDSASRREDRDHPDPANGPFRPLYTVAGAGLIVLALGKYLDRFHLMYSEWGVVAGPGWTDIHIRLPAYWIVSALSLILATAFLTPAVRREMHRRLMSLTPAETPNRQYVPVALPLVALGAVWLLGTGAAPALAQWLKVEPSEITVEAPYLEHNIQFTRLGFGLDKIEVRQFPAGESVTTRTLAANNELLSEVRLWDPRALDAVYEQFQEIRLYYEFAGVDIDRYTVDDEYRQMMVSARDMNHGNLPPKSQTFVNERFKYTHGNGITLAPVSDFTSEGLPKLLVKDIPPQSTHPALVVTRPEIYYGELTTSPVIANSREPEFDYPAGDKNEYSHYSGTGGVELSSFWRELVYGWRFDGVRLLLSSYPTEESRILFRRNVRERVDAIAPFLRLDEDPYIVLDNGKLYWIVDAYTVSDYLPYSEPFASREIILYRKGERAVAIGTQSAGYLDGANYVRNSVKVVVDAFNGSVKLYIFEPDDPLLQAWDRVFPGMFQPRSEMPDGLAAHVRYPHQLLHAQGLVYAKYHMTDPEVFYNQEDLWVRATEKYYADVQPVEPYYIMWKPAETGTPEFTAILPFTPKNRQVLIGWLAGLCDGENYGRLLAYKFPKEKRVPGPQQVETKIDQDPFLSGQLSLWDQRGSRVIRGNVLAIPMDGVLLYVEPIYLQAETAAYPELRLVVAMHNDNLSYGESFDEAISGLLEDERSVSGAEGSPGGRPGPGAGFVEQAQRAFDAYLRHQGRGEFDDAAAALKRLQQALQKLAGSNAVLDGAS